LLSLRAAAARACPYALIDPVLMAQRQSSRERGREGGQQPRAGNDGQPEQELAGISEREVEDVEERSSPRTPVIYEIVRRLGEEEMARPVTSLWWSGVAAGLSISFSLFAQGILHSHLPDTPWRPLVSSLGYSVGFVMVVLARQQLFTENTITVVLPVMADFNLRRLGIMGRMWGIVFLANTAGTLFAAMFCTLTPVISPELRDGMIAVSGQIMHHGWLEMVAKSIGAGFLIAAMVWLIPGAEGAQFHVIVLMTYLIAAGGFMHVVAGSMEAFVLAFNGDIGWWSVLAEFFIPVLIGNIIGGTALFALIAYAQVMEEI
jgi:formate/nitrite transporter FocA (FNT family)